MKLYDIEGDQLLEPMVTLSDFQEAIAKNKPSVSAKDIEKQTEWTTLYGIDG